MKDLLRVNECSAAGRSHCAVRAKRGFTRYLNRQIAKHLSCGLRHARLRHFLLDAGTCRVTSFLRGFFGFLTQHASMLTPRWKPCSPIQHTFRIFSRFSWFRPGAVSASA